MQAKTDEYYMQLAIEEAKKSRRTRRNTYWRSACCKR